jgi:anthranilate/para-aminobenzoate synthase component II
MKFYLVDNGSLFTYELARKIVQAGNTVHVQKYSPYEELDPQDAEIIVLSGDKNSQVIDQLEENEPWYRHEFELIKTTNLPVLGVCLGHQMIAAALGGTILALPELVQEVVNIKLNDIGQQKLGYNNIHALETHSYVVDEIAGTGLIELGRSKDGLEMLYHPERKLLGVQFHPEIFVNNDSESVFWDLIGLIASPVGSHEIA